MYGYYMFKVRVKNDNQGSQQHTRLETNSLAKKTLAKENHLNYLSSILEAEGLKHERVMTPRLTRSHRFDASPDNRGSNQHISVKYQNNLPTRKLFELASQTRRYNLTMTGFLRHHGITEKKHIPRTELQSCGYRAAFGVKSRALKSYLPSHFLILLATN